MQYIIHITPAEWRWVVSVAIVLVLVAFAPFVWVTLSGTAGDQWQFMGVLHDYQNGAAYLSSIQQGGDGNWLIQFLHTPEVHDGALTNPTYTLLGHVTRLITGLSPSLVFVVFHVARVAASLFMYIAIYQLGASIWNRLRTRRIFFILASVGAGLGWLMASLTENVSYADLSLPQAFPFHSTFINVHYPLTIACLALLLSILIPTFVPGKDDKPSFRNGGLFVFILSLIIVFIYPEAIVPLVLTVLMYVCLSWFRERKFETRAWRWGVWLFVPTLPVLLYDLIAVASNPAMGAWFSQEVTPAPDPFSLVIGLGWPLLIGIPGLYRGLRRFSPDGDQLMLLLFGTMLVLLYFPGHIQARFAVGMLLPVAYFATRALEDYWFKRWSPDRRYFVLALTVPLIAASQLFALFVPVSPLLYGRPQESRGILLERDYLYAFEWLDTRVPAGVVVLTAPNVGTWLPVWSHSRAVYGHPEQTLGAIDKRRAVTNWYHTNDIAECESLLSGVYSFHPDYEYTVSYVIVGPEERVLGDAMCATLLRPVYRRGSVTVYAP